MSGEPTPDGEFWEPAPSGISSAQKRLIGFVVVLAVVSAAYRLVYATGFSRTAALYVGLPALLAIGLALLPRSRNATGMLVKGSTLALMIASVVLPEGLICLVFVLPLVVLVAVVVGTVIDAARRRGWNERGSLAIVALPLFVLSLEGVVGNPFDTHDAVVATADLAATSAEVRDALASTPRLDARLPAFLAYGFNRPVSATGEGLDVGDERTIVFTGGDHDDHPLKLFGLMGERSVDHHSEMVLSVAESAERRVVFRIERDETMLSRWARLERAIVTWEPIAGGATRVEWRLEYERLLAPAAYFGPLQRYGMSEAAGYLIDAVIEAPLR